MYWLYICIFIALFTLPITSESEYHTSSDIQTRGVPRAEIRTLNVNCTCQSARSDYTYRYPEVAKFKLDPVFHYTTFLNGPNGANLTWNCNLCTPEKQPIYVTSDVCSLCPQAIQRYTDDYGIPSGQYNNYQTTWQITGRTWHCELCLFAYNLTCVDARDAYAQKYPEIGRIDQVFHYITYGYWSGYQWFASLCSSPSTTPKYPSDFSECTVAQNMYKHYHTDIWNLTAQDHYAKYYLTVGWPWGFQSCRSSQLVIPSQCDCVEAGVVYWSNYPDVYDLDLDPQFHYMFYGPSEPFRYWPCDACVPGKYIPHLDQSSCSCPEAIEKFLSTYNTTILTDGFNTPELAFIYWRFLVVGSGVSWHCEMCPGIFPQDFLFSRPKRLLQDTTCVAARNDYLVRYPSVKARGLDPVAHFENEGYSQKLFWDQSLCGPGTNPLYLTSLECQMCAPAKVQYYATYPVSRTFPDAYLHWRAVYLRTNNVSQQGYVFHCATLCNLSDLIVNVTTTSSTTSISLNSVTTTTTSKTTVTTAAPAGPGPVGDSGTSGSVATSGSVSTATSTGSTSFITASPVTIGFSTRGTTSDNLKSSSDGGGLSANAVLAIVVPIAAVLSVGLGMLFIHQQRRKAVQALIKAEEGERRNYKIDFMSLSIDWLIGSGSFGHVYRGEYRGADVAIKKLKKQNMGNQQLEDFAKEAMIMVGLRHPNIVLFMGVCLERPELCIVTEYMPRGNLYDVLHDSSIKLPFSVVRNMALHVVKGLQFIHSAEMIHRDLKSPNLLVDANWTIKIADFGLSCAKSQITDDVQISLLWTAPEILMREKNCYSEKSDVYSLGIILWELMSRQTPFSEFTAAAIPPVIVLGKRPPVQPEWNPTIKVLMAQCWGQLPSHRPFVREVRVTLESISDNAANSESAGPASIHSSLSSYDDRDTSDTVLPPHGQVTLVFTDVENATALWESDPNTMLAALKLQNALCRKKLKEHGGYEAKTEGDGAMIAFSDPVSAVNFCVSLQEALLHVEWPDELLRQSPAKEEWSDQGVLLYRGLRMRMGVHCGEPHTEQDQISYRTEYFGAVVSVAARVAGHAVGGQVVMTADVHARIVNSQHKLEPCVVEQLGSCQVKGVHEPIVLYQVWPTDVRGRSVQPVLDLTAQHSQQGSSSSSSNNSDAEQYEWNLRHNEKWIINYDDLELDVVIGTGSFGDVFSGTWKGQKVAIKQFMKQKVTDEVLLEMRTESGILSAIEHPNIIRFIGMCIKIPHLCIVTELLERGSLSTILLGNESLSWAQKRSFAIDIARGLEYLHKNNIIHRDVKSPNMLVAVDWTIKIGDFGFSRVKAENHTMTQCGTVAWTAPEIFLGDRYTEKADVYSYSVILWELVFRKKPWQGMNSMKVCHAVENGERLPISNPPSGTPEYIIKLMEACWLQDHEKRPSFTEVLQFLDKTNWN